MTALASPLRKCPECWSWQHIISRHMSVLMATPGSVSLWEHNCQTMTKKKRGIKMIELDKKDIEAIAKARFARKHWNKILVSAILMAALLFGLFFLMVRDWPVSFEQIERPLVMAFFAIFFTIWIGGALLWGRAERKAIKALLADGEIQNGQHRDYSISQPG